MASEIRSFAVSVPAGTPVATPVVLPLTMPARVATSVRVRTPPGPRGEVGWALGAAGVRVLPANAGAFIVADDEAIEWPLRGQISSGAWQLQAYNTGRFAHTLYVVFQLETVGRSGSIIDLSAPLSVTA